MVERNVMECLECTYNRFFLRKTDLHFEFFYIGLSVVEKRKYNNLKTTLVIDPKALQKISNYYKNTCIGT